MFGVHFVPGEDTSREGTTHTTTHKPLDATVQGDITVSSTGGDIELVATKFKGDEISLLAPEGEISFKVAQNYSFIRELNSSENLVWFKTEDKGEESTTVLPVSITATGNLRIEAGEGVYAEYRSKGDLQEDITELSKVPGLEWMDQVRNDPALAGNVDWEGVEEQYREWNETQEGLTGAASAFLSMAIALATAGAGGPLATAISGAVGAVKGSALAIGINAAVTAGIRTVATQATLSLINNKGDLGAVFKDLTASENLKSLAINILNAGLTKGLLPETGGSFLEKLRIESLKSVISSGTGALIGGSDFLETLKEDLKHVAVRAVLASVQTSIGDIAEEYKIPDGDIRKVLGHAVAGGLASKALGGSFEAGAVAAAVSEVSGDILDDYFKTPDERIQVQQLLGAFVVLMMGKGETDVNLAGMIAASVQENNRELHQEEDEELESIRERIDADESLSEVEKEELKIKYDEAACSLVHCAVSYRQTREFVDILVKQMNGSKHTEILEELKATSRFKYSYKDMFKDALKLSSGSRGLQAAGIVLDPTKGLFKGSKFAARLLGKGKNPVKKVSKVTGGVVKPRVSDPKLSNLVDNVYKGVSNPNKVGSGTLGDAVRYELATGSKVHGRSHLIKAQETIRGLEKWVKRNPTALAVDRKVARDIIDDLQKALKGL